MTRDDEIRLRHMIEAAREAVSFARSRVRADLEIDRQLALSLVNARLAARRLHVRPRLVRVQRMTRKWGSCSTSGTITLAIDLVNQEAGFQDFVIAHELLHLRVPNHGKLFKAVMTAHVPDWKEHDVRRGLRPVPPKAPISLRIVRRSD